MNRHKPTQKNSSFGWANDDPNHAARVPIVNYDYESVFQHLDGDAPDVKLQTRNPQPLIEILSPNELQHAFSVAKAILRRASPRSRTMRAAWRDPLLRQKWIAAFARAAQNPEVRRKKSAATRAVWRDPVKRQNRMAAILQAAQRPEVQHKRSETARAGWRDPVKRQKWVAAAFRVGQNPEVQRKKSASLRRAWQTRDRKKAREVILKLWRERRPELLAKMRAGICSSKNRRRASIHFLAMWANPTMRQKTLAKRLTPESRLRQSLAIQRHFQEHPEERQKSAERARAMWRDPAYRQRCSQTLFGRK
ncbi:MAG TPA: hypothetical protein VG077_13490 [Verrucomicrobiae bacterium]|nr:hypothetical protein [Verrucomicrobiae bacterium]